MKVLFAWGLGAGMGHLAPHEPMLVELTALGHEVVVVSRDVAKARKAFAHLGLTILQSPLSIAKPDPIYRPTPTLAHVLHNSGFSHPEQLRAHIESWQDYLRLIGPDLVLIDYCPTLQLALLGSDVTTLVMGTGFFIPPKQSTLPDFEIFKGQKFPRVPAGEDSTIRVVNQALATLKLPKINTLGDIWHAHCHHLLMTFPEFDHFRGRQDGHFIGAHPSPKGLTPVWPERGEGRIFAYLKPTQLVGDLLDALQKTGRQVLVAGDGLSQQLRAQYSSESLRFETQGVDLYEVLETADLMVNNANHGTCAHALLEGVPLALMPLQLEQQVLAQRLSAGNFGTIMSSSTSRTLSASLHEALESETIRSAVKQFQKKYNDFSFELFHQRVMSKLNELMPLS